MLRIFYPQLGFLLLLTLPFAWRLRWLFLGAVLALLLVCPPALGHRQTGSGFTALTWNARGNRVDLPEADVIALQEADWRRVPAERYADAWYLPGQNAPPGMALLSRYRLRDRQVLEGGEWDIPRVMWARIDELGLTVINIHPIPPYTYDGRFHLRPEPRDRQLEELRRQLLDPLLASGEPFVLLGDCNVCEREPGFAELARGLQDAFRTCGTGYQPTWAPGRLARRGVGLLRLDYLLTSPGVTPLETTALPSAQGSDHFPVWGRFSGPPSGAAGTSSRLPSRPPGHTT